MDEIRPLLDNSPAEGADVPHLNLRPRHQELIPTPCGPIKPWAELSRAVQLYFCFTLASMCVLLGLTLASFCGQYDALLEQDLGVSLIQLVGILFCVYYVVRGVLQENRQELCAFLLSVLTLVLRSVLNYSLLPHQEQQKLMLRFVCILCVGVVHVVCTCLLIGAADRMAFRVGGALESVQERYFLLNLCFSMVTFDLQAQLCLCILMISGSEATNLRDSILIGCACIFWSCLTTVVGGVALLKKARVLVLVFLLLNIPEVVFFIYLMFTVISRWPADSAGPHTLVGALLSVGIKMALLGALGRLDKHFRQGLWGAEPIAAG
ncbi:uncharacterized protein LOC130387661 [Gadus chalcogrammus]|uniref:uncharacterized protein LOC130387661 n=1 Tax=Gadus chalcogrammus TaxID=1042646 RepID=UPI0024C40D2B|nr:uncharacterized protein LOC130387661 [Gadus chalcogrammus]